MKIWVLTFLTLLSISSCSVNQNKEETMDFFKPNWEGLNFEKFAFKFGDKFAFSSNNQLRQGIILDFYEAEDGQWYGVCFLNKDQLFGRQIPSGFSEKCIDLLDLSYLHEDNLKKLEYVERVNIDVEKVGIGAKRVDNSLLKLKNGFDYGLEQRKKEQTDCNEGKFSLNPVNECYFELDKIMYK